MEIATLGQVFTPEKVVTKILSLRKFFGNVLEPSAGEGAFLTRLENFTAIEYDKNLKKHDKIQYCDFFSYSKSNKFNTVIGNPPYVKYQDIKNDTKKLLNHNLFDRRSNLYLFFIDKCIDHLKDKGEIIFITPRELFKSTSSAKLNFRLFNEGTFTNYYDLGDNNLFKPYTPNCIIWRWEKGLKDRKLVTGGYLNFNEGQLLITETNNCNNITLGDYFDIKVGAVSGADSIFKNEKYGNKDFVCSMTNKTGQTRKMIYNIEHDYLKKFKPVLLKRGISKFNENNWYKWGRGYHKSNSERIYVNCKTRNKKPFFTHKCKSYDSSILALFPKFHVKINEVVNVLNNMNWNELGFVCDGRYIFSQRSLEKTLLNKKNNGEIKKWII